MEKSFRSPTSRRRPWIASETRSYNRWPAAEGLPRLLARPNGDSQFNLTAVIAHDAESTLQIVTTTVEREYASLTPQCPQAHWFEREIFEQYGLLPVGHPWLKPIRFPNRVQAGMIPMPTVR